jgi:hypothetical protein
MTVPGTPFVKSSKGACRTKRPWKRGCACPCGRPLSQVNQRQLGIPPVLKKRRRPPTNQLMSSFHTAPHAAYWPRRQDQQVEGAGHELAATAFCGGATNAPITVSLDLLRVMRGCSHVADTRPGLDLRASARRLAA